MKIAIIKYNAGNIQSVEYALQRLGITPMLSDQIEELQTADKIIFPGVGEASTAMNYLKNKGLDRLIPQLKQPVLGICLGLQLLCEHSEENDTTCMGIFKVKVKKFQSESLKVPQIGWNTLQNLKNPLFSGIKEDAFVYFVHSYYAELSEQTIAQSNYCLPFSASLHQHNFYATQFHPEKSSENGAKILENFIHLSNP